MSIHKLSISLPEREYAFVEKYQHEAHCSSRSDVIKKAIYLLEQNYLEQCYKEASIEQADIQEDFDSTVSDGIENETW